MRTLWIAASVLSTLWAGPAAACSCLFSGPFSKVGPEGHLVVVGEVISHSENSMQLEVLQVLKGQESRRRITVWGDNGSQCRPYVSQFNVKTRWVLSAFRLSEREAEEDLQNLTEPLPKTAAGPPFYVLSICGAYWLEVRGEDVHGQINKERDSSGSEEVIPLFELEQWFEQGAKGTLSPMSFPRED